MVYYKTTTLEMMKGAMKRSCFSLRYYRVINMLSRLSVLTFNCGVCDQTTVRLRDTLGPARAYT